MTIDATNVVNFPGGEPEIVKMRELMNGWEPLPNDEWVKTFVNPVFPMLRMAWLIIKFDRAAAQAMANRADQDVLNELLENLTWTADYLSELACLAAMAGLFVCECAAK